MAACVNGARVARRFARPLNIPVADLPAFLCPGILRIANLQPFGRQHKPQLSSQHLQRRFLSSALADTKPIARNDIPAEKRMPAHCAGCGALSQIVLKDEPGYYTLTRKSIKEYLAGESPRESIENAIVKAALANAGAAAEGLNLEDFSKPRPRESVEPPVCDRCHKLKHHDTGVSIQHPSVQSIQDTIFESPYKYNHIYHVLDAADFPMSLVPGLHKLLHSTPLRSLNRRSKAGRFYHGRKTEVSFIITRSDLLAPVKEHVDSMMPYLREVLRDALGRAGKDVRLGNIKCVSAKRGWWTKELKEEIWKKGDAGWLVGKVNVGKSQLFHSVFPKGRLTKKVLDNAGTRHILSVGAENSTPEVTRDFEDGIESESELDPLDTVSLLPPAPPETNYPEMPLVSSLPGTTASPIRLAYGNGKGELIDLPGLSRGDLELHVQPEHRSSLVMRSCVRPEQQVIKPGQSVLLGGFIRITPTTPDVTFLAYAFTSLKPHLTSTERAIGTQNQTRVSTVENIALPETSEKIASAGIFHLKWDVTRERAGPLTRRDAAGLSPERLPFQIFSTDILIEGCGWVELVAQIRKKRFDVAEAEEREPNERKPLWGEEDVDDKKEKMIDPMWPTVEVFTPNGNFVASRRPMNAWLNHVNKPAKGRLQGRPRKSMKGAKKAAKIARRAVQTL